jgi:hypothetical protein
MVIMFGGRYPLSNPTGMCFCPPPFFQVVASESFSPPGISFQASLCAEMQHEFIEEHRTLAQTFCRCRFFYPAPSRSFQPLQKNATWAHIKELADAALDTGL